jgi:hypothetical protein
MAQASAQLPSAIRPRREGLGSPAGPDDMGAAPPHPLIVCNLTHHRGASRGHALGQHLLIRAQEPADLMDQRGTSLDEPLAHPMERLGIWLGRCVTGTTRLVGRVTASQMASASRVSCFGDFT